MVVWSSISNSVPSKTVVYVKYRRNYNNDTIGNFLLPLDVDYENEHMALVDTMLAVRPLPSMTGEDDRVGFYNPQGELIASTSEWSIRGLSQILEIKSRISASQNYILCYKKS